MIHLLPDHSKISFASASKSLPSVFCQPVGPCSFKLSIYVTVLPIGYAASKLITNLKAGLDLVNEKYECNPSQINLKDKILFTQNHSLLNFCDLSNVIIGPNMCVLPIDSKIVMEQKYSKIITPCNWVYNKYKKWINEDKIVIWPVGIDTNLFRDTSKDEKNYDCLIYVKNRTPEELEFVMEMMAEFNQTFNVIRYGSYNEEMFLDSISLLKFLI